MTHQDHVSSLSAWVWALSIRLWFPVVLSTDGLRFLVPPTPTEDFCSLTVRLPSCDGPHWGYHVPLPQAVTGVGILFTAGARHPTLCIAKLHSAPDKPKACPLFAPLLSYFHTSR